MQALDQVFGTPAVDSIIIPDFALGLRNNCQMGCWTLGDDPVGNKCEFSILKFSKLFGDLGNTTNALWGQIWLVVESGSSEDIPDNVVLVSYIKTRSLGSFTQLIVRLQSKRINPATGVFCPKYIKHSKGLPDGSTANYYSLEWHWRERTDNDKPIQKLSDCLLHSDSFVDPTGTANMVCLDGLTATEIQSIISGKNTHILGERN